MFRFSVGCFSSERARWGTCLDSVLGALTERARWGYMFRVGDGWTWRPDWYDLCKTLSADECSRILCVCCSIYRSNLWSNYSRDRSGGLKAYCCSDSVGSGPASPSPWRAQGGGLLWMKLSSKLTLCTPGNSSISAASKEAPIWRAAAHPGTRRCQRCLGRTWARCRRCAALPAIPGAQLREPTAPGGAASRLHGVDAPMCERAHGWRARTALVDSEALPCMTAQRHDGGPIGLLRSWERTCG
jgi:hypothetical protein